MDANKLILGLDPSTHTGFVILDGQGNVKTETELTLSSGKLSTAADILRYGREIVECIPVGAIVGVEGFAFSARGDAVSLQYGIGFAIRFALIDAGFEFHEPTPSAVKKFVTGKGTSKKEVMIKEVYKRWGYEHDSNNVVDGYAIARYVLALEEGEIPNGTGSKSTGRKSKKSKA